MGVAVVEDGHIVHTASCLIRPPTMDFNSFNVSIHGITADDVKDSPTFAELWHDIGPSLEGKTVIAHNAVFDFSVLRASLDTYRIPYPQLDYFCTLNFCRSIFPGRIAYKLNLMADMFGIQFEHHDAEEDAAVCAKIAMECCLATGAADLYTLAENHAITTGKLYPGGYSPCRRPSGGWETRERPSDARKYTAVPYASGEGNDGPLFAITGSLQSMTRHEAAQKIVDQGWRFKDGVIKSTNFLVVGEQDFRMFRDGNKSSKLRSAEKLLEAGHPIEIISEDDFLRMLEV